MQNAIYANAKSKADYTDAFTHTHLLENRNTACSKRTNDTHQIGHGKKGKRKRKREKRETKSEFSNEQYTKEADVQRKIWRESKYRYIYIYFLSVFPFIKLVRSYSLRHFVIAVCILFIFFDFSWIICLFLFFTALN